MKRFEVLMTAFKSVIVEAKDADEAEEIAADECYDSKWEIDQWKVEQELKTDADVARVKRHRAVDLEDW